MTRWEIGQERKHICNDPTLVRALGMVVANARLEDPALLPALLWCRHVLSSMRTLRFNGTLLEDVLFDQLLSSLANPYALVHWDLLSDVSVSFFPLISA